MMIYVDLATGNIIQSLTFPRQLDSLMLKRGDNLQLQVIFSNNGVQAEVGNGTETGILGIKSQGNYGGGYLASAMGWTKNGAGSSAVYTFNLNLNTEELATAFGADPEPSDIPAVIEVQWSVGGMVASTLTLSITIQNDVIQGDEGVPISGTPAYPPPGNIVVWRPDIVALTGALGGTVGVTNHSIALAGTGTTFTTALIAGDLVLVNGVTCVVATITSDTSATIGTAWAGATAAGVALSRLVRTVESVATAGVTPGYLLAVAIGGALGFYNLQVGAANVGAGDVAPLDFNAGAPLKWVKVL